MTQGLTLSSCVETDDIEVAACSHAREVSTICVHKRALMTRTDMISAESGLDMFHVDPDFEQHEAQWVQLKKELLGDDESAGRISYTGSGFLSVIPTLMRKKVQENVACFLGHRAARFIRCNRYTLAYPPTQSCLHNLSNCLCQPHPSRFLKYDSCVL